MHDLRLAFRQLGKSPGFTAIAVLTLAIGIGGCTAIFSVVNSVLLRALPFFEPEQLVQLWECPPERGAAPRVLVSGPTFRLWRQHSTSFENMALFMPNSISLTGGRAPEQLKAAWVSADYLNVFRVRPLAGRDFDPAADQLGGNANVVLLSYNLWQTRFGGDPAMIDRTIMLGHEPFTVIGILPPRALPRDDIDVLVPLVLEARSWQLNPTNQWAVVTARLKHGVSPEQAQAELNAIKRARLADFPSNREQWTAEVVSMHTEYARVARPTLLLLLGAVGLVLLIACANVANLLLVRATARQREIAVRMALGASTGRIVRQMLTESVVLALLGGALGLLIAMSGVDVLANVTQAAGPAATLAAGPTHDRLIGDGLPAIMRPEVDLTVLAFSFAVAGGTGIFFGLFPALRARRTDLNRDLKEAARGSTSGSRTRAQSLLVGAEVALTVALLIGAGLLLRSFANLTAIDPGFKPRGTLAFDTVMSRQRFADDLQRATQLQQQIIDRLASLPGVESVGTATTLPFSRVGWAAPISLAENPDPAQMTRTSHDFVGGDYFQAIGVPLLKGRVLKRDDNAPDAPRVAVISEELATALLPDQEIVGRQILFEKQLWEVVGVVGNVRHGDLVAPRGRRFYGPHVNHPWTASYVLRTHGAPPDLEAQMRRAVLSVDPDQPLANVRTLEHAIGKSLEGRRMMLTLLGTFAAVALALACLGIYGVMAFTIGQRQRELSIRIALGAAQPAVVRLVLRDGLKLILGGLVVGLAVAAFGTRVVSSLLYGVPARDPIVFISVAAMLTLFATVACWLPARRAAHADPMQALRAE